MGVRAKCSRCDYLRTFADELRGTFYRCPKCRQGVIAVPTDADGQAESEEAPSVQAARLPDNSSSEGAARALESPSEVRDADAETDPRLGVGLGVGVDETPQGVLMLPHGAATAPPETGSSVEAEPTWPSGNARAAARGQTFKVRRILVECVSCGHHVAVPPAFFGKTIHCPECRADMAFSGSSLEPVKDEILGRIALEQAERRVLSHAVPPPIESPEVRRRARRRQLAIAGALALALVGGLALVAWKAFGPREGASR